MRAKILMLTVGAILAMTAGWSFAAGSLAIDSLQGREYGFSFNHPSYGLADERAKRECGADCSIVKRFENQCAAYAADQAAGSSVYGWSEGPSSSAVQSRALSECRAQGGTSCLVRAWGCDTMKAADKKAVSAPTVPADNPLLGDWTADYTTSRGYSASGVLRVQEFIGKGVYRGILTWSFLNNGKMERAQEDVLISNRGDTVTINGSNPVMLVGDGSYSADNYTTTMIGDSVLKGVNRDSSGKEGIVVFVKSATAKTPRAMSSQP